MKKGDEKLGHICIALAYAPNPQLLAVFILSCKDLKSTDEGGFSGKEVLLHSLPLSIWESSSLII